jgi:integrase
MAISTFQIQPKQASKKAKKSKKRLLSQTVTETNIEPLFSTNLPSDMSIGQDGKLQFVDRRYSREQGTGTIDAVEHIVKGKPYKYFRGRVWIGNELGISKRKTIYAKSRAKVERELKKLRDIPAASIDAEKTSLEDYLTDWLRTVKSTNSVGTYNAYKSTVDTWIIPKIGPAKLGRFSGGHARQFMLTLSEENVSAPTRAAIRKVLNRAFQVAIQDGLLNTNPMDRTDKVKMTRRPIHILTNEETNKLLDAAEKEGCYELVLCALTTGMREGELFGLTWPDVHFEKHGGFIHVQHSLKPDHDGKLVLGSTKSLAGNRKVDLDPVTLRALKDLKEKQEQVGYCGSYVFTSPQGNVIRKPNFTKRTWARIKKSAKITDLKFHDLRHKANSELARAGVSLKVMQARLGDSTARMVLETYSHLLPGEQAAAAVKIGKMFALRDKSRDKLASTPSTKKKKKPAKSLI